MLSPTPVTMTREEQIEGALACIREDVEAGRRERTLKRKLRTHRYPKGVIAEVMGLIFNDDDDDVIEMAAFRTRL